jgi:hypothetical protein
MTSAAGVGQEEHVLEPKKSSNFTIDGQENIRGFVDDARRRLATEAIEQIASGLDLAAHTIEEFSQNVIKMTHINPPGPEL